MVLINKALLKIKSSIHNGMNDISKHVGIRDVLLREARGSRIIAYHGIDLNHNQKYNSRFISQKLLDNHLSMFKCYFDIVSVDDIVQNNLDPNRFSIAITFDDGYLNNLSYAIPVINKHQVPATFCITGISETELPILWADLLDINASENKQPLTVRGISYSRTKKYPWSRYEYKDREHNSLKSLVKKSDNTFRSEVMTALYQISDWNHLEELAIYWRQLNQDQIKVLASTASATIASHGYYHNALSEIPIQDAKWEMIESKSFLENIINEEVTTIAYPYGSYNTTVIQEASKIGYKIQLLAESIDGEESIQNNAIRERLTINPYISAYNQAIAIINGYYH